MGTGGIVALVVGGLAVAGGLTYWAISSSQKKPTAAPARAPANTGIIGTIGGVVGLGTQAAGFVDTTAHAVDDVSSLFN